MSFKTDRKIRSSAELATHGVKGSWKAESYERGYEAGAEPWAEWCEKLSERLIRYCECYMDNTCENCKLNAEYKTWLEADNE